MTQILNCKSLCLAILSLTPMLMSAPSQAGTIINIGATNIPDLPTLIGGGSTIDGSNPELIACVLPNGSGGSTSETQCHPEDDKCNIMGAFMTTEEDCAAMGGTEVGEGGGERQW